MPSIFQNTEENNLLNFKNIILPHRIDPSMIDMGVYIKPFHPKIIMQYYPFGVPRPDQGMIEKYRELSDNSPTITAAINMRKETVAATDFKIISDSGRTDIEKKVKKDILYPKFGDPWMVKVNKIMGDVLKINAGCFVKSFNNKGQMVRFDVFDGSSILKNPDWHGHIDYRADYIDISDTLKLHNRGFPNYKIGIQEDNLPGIYGGWYKAMTEIPAYYQYGAGVYRIPIPLGKREVVFFEKDVRSYEVYGMPLIQTLWNVLKTIYFNDIKDMEYIVNNGIPPGVMSMVNAEPEHLKAFKEQLNKSIIFKDGDGDIRRHWWKNLPTINQEVKYIPLPIPSKDMQLLETMQGYYKLVWAVYGIPPTILGMGDHPTFRNMGTEKQNFYELTGSKDLKMIEAGMNNHILNEYEFIYGLPEDDLMFEFVYDDLETEIKETKLWGDKIEIGLNSVDEYRVEKRLGSWEDEKWKQPTTGGGGGGFPFGGGNLDEEGNDRNEKEEYMNNYQGKSKFFEAEELSDEEVLEMIKPGGKSLTEEEMNNILFKKKTPIELKWKYIRREGGPGNYRYWYKDPKTGKLVEGAKPKETKKEPKNIDDIFNLIKNGDINSENAQKYRDKVYELTGDKKYSKKWVAGNRIKIKNLLAAIRNKESKESIKKRINQLKENLIEKRGHLGELPEPFSKDSKVKEKKINQISTDLNISKERASEIQDSIHKFTDQDYKRIRHYQTTEKPKINLDFTSPDHREYYDKIIKQGNDLEEYITKAPKFDSKIYRGIEIDKDSLDNFKLDTVIDMKGTSSWTSDKEAAEDFSRLSEKKEKINVVFFLDETNTSTSIAHLTLDSREKEVLMSKKNKLKIINKYEKNGIYYINLLER